MPSENFAVLSGAEFYPVPELPLAVFRVPTHHHFRHGHDFCEMVLVTRGQAEHELFPPQGDDLSRFSLTRGSLFLVPIGWTHCYHDGEECEIINLLFDGRLFNRWLGEEAFQAPLHLLLQRGECEYLETQLQTMMRELTGRQHGFELTALAKLAEILVWAERLNIRLAEKRESESQVAVSKAIAFMEQHFAEAITLEDIAKKAHLSPHYFCEVFKSATGLPPGRYLARLRLEQARYLLLTTQKPVTEIAREAGYSDPSYFARAFKASFNTAPSRLRRTGK